MKNRIFKRITAIICIMAMVLPVSSEVLAKITSSDPGTTQVFGIAQYHKSSYLNGRAEKDFGYKVNSRFSYRIFAGEDNADGYANTILCLDEKGKFPGEDSKDKNYTSQGTAQEALASISTSKNGSKTPLTSEDIQKINWLMHNAALPEDSTELIDIKLAKIFEQEIKETATTQNPLTLDYIKEILTQDDLVFALQATIWTITNAHNNPVYYGKTRDGSQYNSLTGNDVMNERGKQGLFINIIMNFYKNNYLGEDLFPRVSDNLEMPTVTVPDKKIIFTNTDDPLGNGEVKGQESDPYIFVGPFKIEHKSNTADYSIDVIFKDENNSRISAGQGNIEFYVKREPRTDAQGLSLTQESLNGEQFYIAFHKGTKVRKIEFKLTPMNVTIDSKATVWTNTDPTMQPLISVERTETEIESTENEYEFGTNYKRKFDVSLRKEIVAVYRCNNPYNKWAKVDIGSQDRVLSQPKKSSDESFNQFEYEHKKVPVVVEVGDIVEYTIRVYNEGMHPVRITKVMDYLPPAGGLQLIETPGKIGNHDVIYGDYNLEVVPKATGEQVIVISSKIENSGINNADLQGRIIDSNMPKFLEINLQFYVTEAAKGRIVTNIAEVTEFLGQQDLDGDGNGKGDFLPQEDVDSKPHNIDKNLPGADQEWQDYTGNGTNKEDLTDNSYYYKGQEDDDDFEKIVIPGEKKIDLALRKSITAQNGKPIERQMAIDPSPLLNGAPTSKFSDIKEPPVNAKVGDKIVYTIRVFNEGNQDGYATKITDYIPKGLGFLPTYTENISNKWVVKSGDNIKNLADIPNATANFQSSEFTITGSEDYKNQKVFCGEAVIETEALKDDKIEKFNKSTQKLDVKPIQVTCIVLEPEAGQESVPVRNIAAITRYADENKNEITKDSDSDSNNDLSNFNEENHQDDEDYEKLIVDGRELPYDLALKKFVSSVTDGTNTPKTIPDDQKRNLIVTNVEQLKQRQDASVRADATYSFGVDKDPNPVKIERGDYVTYTIRVYNEGLIDGKVEELVDSVPEGLTFLPDSTINKKYGWKEFNEELNTGWKTGVKTTILKNTTIRAFNSGKESESNYDPNTGTGIDKGVSYAEVKIEFKVNDKAKNSVKIKNIAEITKDDNDDNDSTPDNKKPEEDDEDFDVILPGKFDLALRKFITKIGDDNITDRIPKVDTTELDSGKSTTAKYQHPKQEDTKVVVTGDVVEYTIRIYNEGNESGYASEIKDDIPEGLAFLPDNETNKTYMWKMYDKDGNETEDTSKAVSVRTNYRSKENGTEKTGEGDTSNPYYKTNTNIINAYDPARMKDGPDYVDVVVAFKVVKTNVTDGKTVIINTAEITEETDENGEEVVDTDSIPDNDKPNEDDIDKEYIQLKYFDLSLLKYVTKVIVTEDGVTKETETGYDGTENPEPVVKVELNKNKLAQTQVKYVYTIKITNEGQIEGYAKEITDRIPNGLLFDPADNKAYGWVEKETGILTTDYLKETLLKPGESATVPVVLTWWNSETNLGQKVNVAEISVDDNEYGIPDIDSTPNNNVDGEDDQDEAIVVLSINTGSAPLYITLITIVTAILGTGLYLIYKYVVKR